MLDPKTKSKWLRALRSGKYRRGRNQLRTKENTFCCLGVLCECLKADYQPEDGELPRILVHEIDFPDRAQGALASLNDGTWNDGYTREWGDAPKGYKPQKGAPFTVIADWIKKHL